MIILWEKGDWGGPKPTWRLNHGNMTRNKTALRKVTNRFAKRKLWLNGSSIKPY